MKKCVLDNNFYIHLFITGVCFACYCWFWKLGENCGKESSCLSLRYFETNLDGWYGGCDTWNTTNCLLWYANVERLSIQQLKTQSFQVGKLFLKSLERLKIKSSKTKLQETFFVLFSVKFYGYPIKMAGKQTMTSNSELVNPYYQQMVPKVPT